MSGGETKGILFNVSCMAAVAFCAFSVLALGGAVFLCAYYPSVAKFVTSGFIDGMTYFCVIGFVWCVCELAQRWIPCYGKYESLILALLALLVSGVSVYLSYELGHLKQVSDSAETLKSLTGDGVSYAHSTVVYWRNYELLISMFSSFFSDRVMASLFVNSFCYAAIVFLEYWSVMRMYGMRTARAVSLLLALSPSFALYTVHLSGEFLAVTLLFYAAYIFWRLFASDDVHTGSAVAKVMVVGVLLGASQLFKPISFLYIIAAFLACVVIRTTVRSWRMVAVYICLMTMFFMGSKMFGQAVLNQAVRAEHRDLKGALSDGLIKGLNVSSVGEFEPGLAKKLCHMDAAEQWTYLKTVVARDFCEYPKLFFRKFLRLYGSPGHYLYKYALALRSGGCYYIPPQLVQLIKGEHVLFRIVFCIGAFGFLLAVLRRRNTACVFPGLTSVLLIMGFTALLMVYESAVRYKTSIYPFYFVLLAYSKELWAISASASASRSSSRLWYGRKSLVVVLAALAFCALFVPLSLGCGIVGAKKTHDDVGLIIPALDSDVNFALVAGKLSSGYEYRFECENIIVEHGVADYIDVRLYDRLTWRNYWGCTLRVDDLSRSTGSRQWSFVTPARHGDYQVRIHAGRIGRSRGVGLRCINARVIPIKPVK